MLFNYDLIVNTVPVTSVNIVLLFLFWTSCVGRIILLNSPSLCPLNERWGGGDFRRNIWITFLNSKCCKVSVQYHWHKSCVSCSLDFNNSHNSIMFLVRQHFVWLFKHVWVGPLKKKKNLMVAHYDIVTLFTVIVSTPQTCFHLCPFNIDSCKTFKISE